MKERFSSEQGSFSLEAAFTAGLIVIILGVLIRFSLSLHDRVQLSRTAERAAQAACALLAEGKDPAGLSEETVYQNAGLLISDPETLEVCCGTQLLTVRCSAQIRRIGGGLFAEILPDPVIESTVCRILPERKEEILIRRLASALREAE